MTAGRLGPRAEWIAHRSLLGRLVVAVVVGIAVAVAIAVPTGTGLDAPVVGWTVAAVLFLVPTWLAVGGMDAERTASHATREDPTSGVARLILLLASVASLAGVALMLSTTTAHTQLVNAALGVASVAGSWFVVHTVYTLQYAALYYAGPDGGIDFNQSEPPAYADFAYIGFTLGMTYQVSDTTISSSAVRRVVLHHSLLSYLLGAVVLAITINLVGGLAS